MSHIITREFSVTRDWKSVAWGATLWHNLLRSACAGLVWGVFAVISEGAVEMIFLMPIVLPLAYLLLLPLGLICAFLSSFIPFIGLITLLPAMFVIPGDPIVWLLSLIAPRLVPMDKPGFLSFSLIIWLLKPEEFDELVITDTAPDEQPD